MALRVEEYKTKMDDHAMTLLASPWIPSGWEEASDVIKAEKGLLGGIIARSEDTGTDIVIKVWDSADGTTGAGYVELARIYFPDTARRFEKIIFPLPGVEAKLGIYVEIAGDVEYEVYYK